MSKLPNLIWIEKSPTWTMGAAFGSWSAENFYGSTAYVPASGLEQAQDKLAEYGEEIARLREALMPFAQHYADWSDFSYDEPLVEGTWSGGPENATFLTVGHLKVAMEAMR